VTTTGAARHTVPRGLDMPLRRGEAAATGVSSGEGLGTAGCAGRGEDDNGMAQAHKGELRRCDAHVADATTPRVVGLVERAYLLAHTGRGHRRWDGRQLEMPQDARDH